MLGLASVLLVLVSTLGAGVEYEIVCPPNDGITKNGNFSDEPLKENLKNGDVSRIHNAVERALAKLSCANQSQMADGSPCTVDADCESFACAGGICCTDCGGSCVDTSSNIFNCGECGISCDKECVGGVCSR